jgi:hypothetical protein
MLESSPDGSNPSLSNPQQPDSTFTGDLEGDYVLALIAGDGIDWGEPDMVVITVGESGLPCPWDLDGDGMVGMPDFELLWGSFGPCADPGNCPADFDGDGSVAVRDFLALLANWGPCP